MANFVSRNSKSVNKATIQKEDFGFGVVSSSKINAKGGSSGGGCCCCCCCCCCCSGGSAQLEEEK